MLLHCTKRLAAKLPQDQASNASTVVSPDERMQLGDWHGHLLLLDRRQCVMFCHDCTRYVLFLPGLRAAQFADLGRWHQELFLATLAVQGLPSSHLARLELLMGPLQFDCQTDRSVLGSLRVAADDLSVWFLASRGQCLGSGPSRDFPYAESTPLQGWKGLDLAGRGNAEVG
ncbi:MAG TPA: hypothetical protein VFX56_12700 [Nitrospira sp.]|nr:hypothetical protein [Nitrospira sp.]